MLTVNEHIKRVSGTPEWYNYDFKIAINYLKFVITLDKDLEHLKERIEFLESNNFPEQVIVQDIMARL